MCTVYDVFEYTQCTIYYITLVRLILWSKWNRNSQCKIEFFLSNCVYCSKSIPPAGGRRLYENIYYCEVTPYKNRFVIGSQKFTEIQKPIYLAQMMIQFICCWCIS